MIGYLIISQDGNLRGQTAYQNGRSGLGRRDVGAAGGAIDSHGIDGAVAAAGGASQVGGNLLDAGAGKIVDVDEVREIEGLGHDLLDAVDVHGDRADAAGGQLYARSVGGDVDRIRQRRVVENQRIGAAAALDGVAAVAGIPGAGIVAAAQRYNVVAAPARDGRGRQR